MSNNQDIESLLKDASKVYGSCISRISSMLDAINELRKKRIPISARQIWEIGDYIFKLVSELEKLTLQIDGIYDHLERDLGVKRKWLEKVIILRRYIQDKDRIPNSLNWGKCEKGTRRKAELIQKGLLDEL
ncbi:MAG: hypothetical protein ACTSUO_04255 [Candidatus Thorarchaeota archaeon]